MPGANCSIFGCPVSRRKKYNESIFSIPIKSNDPVKNKWREELINVISKDRVLKMNQTNSLHICERHFSSEQMWIYHGRKLMKDGVIPTLNLPIKSINFSISAARDNTSILKREEILLKQQSTTPVSSKCYSSFTDFQHRILSLHLGNDWLITNYASYSTIMCLSPGHVLSKFEIYIDTSLKFIVRVYGWLLKKDHVLYEKYQCSFGNINVKNFVRELSSFTLCHGVNFPDEKNEIYIQRHVIPCTFSFTDYLNSPMDQRFIQLSYYRSNSCELLIEKDIEYCNCCIKYSSRLSKIKKDNNKQLSVPAKLKAPISCTSSHKLKLLIQSQRLHCKQLQDEIEQMYKAIDTNSLPIDCELNNDLLKLFSGCDEKKIPPFMKLFWQEQQKYIKASSSKSIRYHPMIVKFCLSLASKSPSAYNDLRYDSNSNSGFLILPSLRTLRDYKNYIYPQRGFNHKVIEELHKKTEHFSLPERFVIILMDEMKVQEDLVWDKHSGELIGYVDLGDVAVNYSTLKNVTELATHALVFLVKSVVNPLSQSFATFATTGAAAYQIFPIFWKAVNILENINLKVIAATADGASSNQLAST